MRYYISDLHFYHENLLTQMDNRGFADVEKMHAYMVKKWNDRVREKDEVVILGDVSMERGKLTSEILSKLHGRLFLIRGNHDRYLKDRHFDCSRFEWVKDYEECHDNKRKIILSHYPILCYNGQYRRDKEGNPRTYMLYGHVHNTRDEVMVNRFIRQMRACVYRSRGEDGTKHIPCQMINCFCMFSDYTPLTLEEWIEVDTRRRAGMENENSDDREDI